jgi:hypothetical protein
VNRLAVLVGAAALVSTTGYAVGAHRPGRVPSRFAISGHVGGLTPGVSSPLPLVIRNPWGRAIRVTSVATLVEPSGQTCPVSNVRIPPFAGSLVVPAHSKRTLVLEASLRAGAPTECAGATFPLKFWGTARRP